MIDENQRRFAGKIRFRAKPFIEYKDFVFAPPDEVAFAGRFPGF
jgi:hypothetical protein